VGALAERNSNVASDVTVWAGWSWSVVRPLEKDQVSRKYGVPTDWIARLTNLLGGTDRRGQWNVSSLERELHEERAIQCSRSVRWWIQAIGYSLAFGSLFDDSVA
jgi:hypothetical protein